MNFIPLFFIFVYSLQYYDEHKAAIIFYRFYLFSGKCTEIANASGSK